MTDALDIQRIPRNDEIYMIAGWRQWADAGSVSSELPEYLIETLNAEKIGTIRPDGFYLFQIPGTHDLVRPSVKFTDGYPELLESQKNEFYYAQVGSRGLVIFVGDEPHMDIERYTATFLDAAETLGVHRIIGLGGVYGELPYDRERILSANYSLPRLKSEVERLAVSLSDYQGGASIGSYICKRAGERAIEWIGLYALVPAYDFSTVPELNTAFRLETDYFAWLGILRRLNFMFKLGIDLTDLEERSQQLMKLVDDKIEEIDTAAPSFGVREYLRGIGENYTESPFNPLDEVWEEELRRLMDKFDDDEDPGDAGDEDAALG